MPASDCTIRYGSVSTIRFTVSICRKRSHTISAGPQSFILTFHLENAQHNLEENVETQGRYYNGQVFYLSWLGTAGNYSRSQPHAFDSPYLHRRLQQAAVSLGCLRSLPCRVESQLPEISRRRYCCCYFGCYGEIGMDLSIPIR